MEEIIQEALSKGVKMHIAGEFDLACQLYESVLKLKPEHADANHNMGLLKLDTGYDLEALPYLQTALQADTSIVQFWLSYVNALIKLERMDEAGRILDLAIESGIDAQDLNELYDKLNKPNENFTGSDAEVTALKHSQPNILDSLKLDQALKLASKNIKEGASKEAKRIYQDILKKFPQNIKARRGLTALSKPPREAINELITLYNQGQLAAAVEQAKTILEKYPNAFEVWNILGAAYKGLGEIDEASRAFRKVTELNPKYADGFSNLGAVLHDQGKANQAIDAYNRAISLKPYNASSYYNMGVTLQEQGKLEEAIEAYKKVLSIKSDNTSALSNMATSLRDQGKLEEAITAYLKLLHIEPNQADVYNGIGITRLDQGDLEEAIKNFDKALSIDPDCVEAYANGIGVLKLTSRIDTSDLRYFHKNVKFNSIGDKLLTASSDSEIASHLSKAFDHISEEEIDFKTAASQIFKQNSVDLNCKRHLKIFNQKGIIPEFCFGCFKVQVDVDSLFSLIRLTRLFYNLQFDQDLTRKTMIELRPDIPGFYKGLFYCNGLKQARQLKETLDTELEVIFPGQTASKIKRGCSEYPIKFPDYGKIINDRKTEMDYPYKWTTLEHDFDKNYHAKAKNRILPSMPGFGLSDFYIIQKWVDYAKGLDDPSCEWFKSRPVIFEDAYNAAVERKRSLK